MNLHYVIFLLFVILASLFVYFTFGEMQSLHAFGKRKESMVTIGADLTVAQDIPGARYETPTPQNRKTKGINGYGIDPPQGYYKIEVEKDVWKMKPTIPTGFKVNPSDKTKLIVDPKNEVANYAITAYKTKTDAELKQGPYKEIPLKPGETLSQAVLLPDADPNTKISTKYYRIAPFKDEKGNDVLSKYMMKDVPNPIPKGYIIDENNYLIWNPDVTEYAFSTFDSAFDPTKVDTVYHGEVVAKTEQASNDQLGKYYSFDANGQLVREENTDASFSPVLYYVPGAYKYGSSNYVPNYEDSVYLSRTTRLPQPAPVYNTAGMLGGFCTQHKGNNFAIEEKCQSLDLNTCASTSCCTLIGGQKCVAGNANGPTNPANYSDATLRNKDFYYYQGKCYGNCSGN